MEYMTAYSLYLWLIQLTEDLFTKEFSAAIVGALIGGGLSFLSIQFSHWLGVRKSLNEQITITKSTLQLLKVEINTAWTLYNLEYAKDLLSLDDGKPYFCIFPLGSNLFPLYDSAPSCLANIPQDTASDIVRLYMRMKGIATMIDLNNSDYTQAQKNARDSIQPILNKLVEDGKYEIELAQKIYIQHLNFEAEKMLMGSTADGLKLVTSEVEGLIQGLNKSIEQFISPRSKLKKVCLILKSRLSASVVRSLP